MRRKGDTLNFNRMTIDYMAEHPNEKANEIGKEVPYHLRYKKDGKPVVEPGKENVYKENNDENQRNH